MDDPRARSDHADHRRRQVEDRDLGWVADVDRPGHRFLGRHQAQQAIDHVVDITERAGLQAVAVDRDVVAEQRLHDEVRHHPAVVRVHARAISVEDARDLDAHAMLAPVIEEQRLGAALAFVVAGPDPDRIDAPPIVLGLRMDFRIAVDLGGRRLQDLGAGALGEAEHVDGAVDAGLGGLHRIVLIVHGRGRAGQVVDLVDLDIERKRDVVAHQLEPRMTDEMREVVLVAGEEVVHAEDVVARRQQALAKMRAQEAGPAGDEDSLHGQMLRFGLAGPQSRLAGVRCDG